MAVISLDSIAALAKNFPLLNHFGRREAKLAEAVKAVTDLKVNASDVKSIKIVQAEIDFATAGNRTVADHGLGVNIPVGAVVTRVWRKVTADLDSTSQTGTAQLYLGASSGSQNLDIALACDGASVIEAWNEIVDGTSKKPYNQTVASSAKELTVKIATNAITSTSGKIQYLVEYITPS